MEWLDNPRNDIERNAFGLLRAAVLNTNDGILSTASLVLAYFPVQNEVVFVGDGGNCETNTETE